MSESKLAPAFTIDSYYELRLYQMLPGRMPEFHDLMGAKVPPLFAKHGIPEPLGFWEGYAGPMAPLYAYMLHWSDLDARLDNWKRFYGDPEWQAVMKANYAGQQRLERANVSILRPSPVWQALKEPASDAPVGGVHELRIHDLVNLDPNLAHQSLAEHDLPFFKARGARVLGVFATWFGTRMNQAVTLLAWPDMKIYRAANIAHQTDPGLAAVWKEERDRYGRPLVRGIDVHLMTPIDYGMPRANLVGH